MVAMALELSRRHGLPLSCVTRRHIPLMSHECRATATHTTASGDHGNVGEALGRRGWSRLGAECLVTASDGCYIRVDDITSLLRDYICCWYGCLIDVICYTALLPYYLRHVGVGREEYGVTWRVMPLYA